MRVFYEIIPQWPQRSRSSHAVASLAYFSLNGVLTFRSGRHFHTSHIDDDTTPQYTLLTVNLKPQFASTTSKPSSAGGAGAAGMAAVETAPTAGGAGACFATISNAPSFGANA